jgi:phospholipase D-like protein
MAVLAYTLLWVSVGVVVLCLGHIWLQGLAHALGARGQSPTERSHKLLWVGAMLLFGWLGAVTYWLIGCPRSA